MLTTHQIVRNATSLLWPSLLVIIAWYCIAASMRAFFEFVYRIIQRRRVARRLSRVAAPLMEDSAHTTPMFVPMVENRLEGLQEIVEESLLLGRKATPARIGMSFLEGLLFSILAVVAMIGAKPALVKLGSVWWMHLVGVVFFLCFILRARRLLLLIPLTFLVWSSWEMFAFISSFEKTLEASSLLASVEILEKNPNKFAYKLKIRLSFKGKHPQIITLSGHNELFFKGRVYRVSPEVLLFGGKNIATVDQVFSDDMKPKDALILLKSESVPPLYRWRNYEKNFREAVRRKFSHWLWKQFFELRETRLVKTRLLEAPRCSPIRVGQKFELRLRHVGGLECHAKEYLPPSFRIRTPSPQAPVNPPSTNSPANTIPVRSPTRTIPLPSPVQNLPDRRVTPAPVRRAPPVIRKLEDLKGLQPSKGYVAPYLPFIPTRRAVEPKKRPDVR